MNIVEELLKIFTPAEGVEPKIKEKFTTFSITYIISNFTTFDDRLLADFNSLVSDSDNLKLVVKVDENEPIDLTETKFEVLHKRIQHERGIYEDEPVIVKLEINKSTTSHINIYCFKCFEQFWAETNITSLLKLLKIHKNEFNKNDFIVLEDNQLEFSSANIAFSSQKLQNPQRVECSIAENCHFTNQQEYPFDAKYFYVAKSLEEESPIIEKLSKLCLLFSIISIFDITTINESEFYYKLNGYKSFEDTIKIDEIDTKLAKIYFKISSWIYTENSNVFDKIGLVRNILSLSFQSHSLFIHESTFLSIQSGYKAYLQENVSRYIEIRNKIVDELEWVSQKSGEIVSNFLGNYQKSIFTFLSFFISVFLLRFLKTSDSGTAIFSKEVTLFSYSFLFLSAIFLVYSQLLLKKEKERLERKYTNIKNRYLDLLDINDIERILRKDSEFKYELSYIESKKNSYTQLWIITLIVLVLTVFSVSNYFSWCDLIELVKRIA